MVIIEDNFADVELIKEACLDWPFKTELLHFENGVDLFSHFQNNSSWQPSFMDGKVILKKINGFPEVRLIPSIIFSTSSSEKDVRKCLTAGANANVGKPGNYDAFEQTVQSIFNFWGC